MRLKHLAFIRCAIKFALRNFASPCGRAQIVFCPTPPICALDKAKMRQRQGAGQCRKFLAHCLIHRSGQVETQNLTF